MDNALGWERVVNCRRCRSCARRSPEGPFGFVRRYKHKLTQERITCAWRQFAPEFIRSFFMRSSYEVHAGKQSSRSGTKPIA
jgi:hypothetical protein